MFPREPWGFGRLPGLAIFFGVPWGIVPRERGDLLRISTRLRDHAGGLLPVDYVIPLPSGGSLPCLARQPEPVMSGGEVNISHDVKIRDTRATKELKNVDAATHANTKTKGKTISHRSSRGEVASAPGLALLVASIEEQTMQIAATAGRSMNMEVDDNEGSRKRVAKQADRKRRKRSAVAASAAIAASIPTPMEVSTTPTAVQPLGQPLSQPLAQSLAQPLAQPLAQSLAQSLAQPLAQPLGQPPPPPHNHTVPDNAEESVPRTFRRLWAIDPKRAERYAADQVYAHNANVPYLLGKAVVLRERASHSKDCGPCAHEF